VKLKKKKTPPKIQKNSLIMFKSLVLKLQLTQGKKGRGNTTQTKETRATPMQKEQHL
jgi:hypothetical protein